MPPIDNKHITAELAAIRAEKNAAAKGKRLEDLIALIFVAIPGIRLEAQDIESDYNTEEIDLFLWNDRERDGLHFLDSPLIVESKGWSKAVDGRTIRYFADLLKDRGRANGIFIALEGVTGKAKEKTAGFFHVAVAMAAGQTVIILTGEDLETITSSGDLISLLQRRLMDQVKGQVLSLEGTGIKRRSGARGKKAPAKK